MAQPTSGASHGRDEQLRVLANGYSPAQRAIETVALVAFFALMLLLFVRVAGAVTADRAWVVALASVAAFFLADFISGLIHWAADTWGTVQWPIVGKALIRPFREHHLDQKAITRHDFVETNGAIALVAIPILAGALLLPLQAMAGFSSACFLAFMCLWGCPTGQIHKWAHEDEVPAAVAWLQRRGVLLSPVHHARHHTQPFNEAYCIASGVLNEPLRRVGFFRRAEAVVSAFTKAVPRQDDQRMLGL